MTNTNKMLGKIVENGYTRESFSAAIGMSRRAFYNKMCGKTDWTVSEMEKICDTLNIPRTDMADYFFAD